MCSVTFFKKKAYHAERWYVGVLISLWAFQISYFQHNQKNFSWMG
jgi:hypothetical protein